MSTKADQAAKKLEVALSIMEAQHTLDEPDKTTVEQMIEQALRLLKTKSQNARRR